jgi:hypothetical protein
MITSVSFPESSQSSVSSESSESASYRARTVFLDGTPWTPDPTAASRATISIYPIRLCVPPNSTKKDKKDKKNSNSNNNNNNNSNRDTNNAANGDTDTVTDGDYTRLYDQQDSADTPYMQHRNTGPLKFDPHCKPMAEWQSTYHPVCNEVHASPLHENLAGQSHSKLLGSGDWRSAWRIKEDYSNDNNVTNGGATVVWKTWK